MSPLAWSCAVIIAFFAMWLSRRMRRRGAESLAASALLYLGLGCAAFVALTSVSEEETVRTQVFKFAAVTTSLTASVVCGLIALSRSERGRRSKLVALVITAGFAATLQWTIIYRHLDRLTAVANAATRPTFPELPQSIASSSRASPAIKAEDAKVGHSAPMKVSPVLGQTMRDFFAGKSTPPPVDTQPVTMEELNFRFAPPGQWEVLDAKKINPAACFAMARFSDQQMLIIICEQLPEEFMPDLEIFGKMATANLKAMGVPKLISQKEFTHQGAKGLRIENEIARGFVTNLMIHQVVVNRGFAWQIIFNGQNREAQKVRKLADEMLAGFTILNLARTAGKESEKIEPKFSSPLGWSLDLTSQKAISWNRKWTQLAADFPEAEFGIMNGISNAGLIARSIWLPEASSSIEATATAFLEHFGLQVDSPNISKRESITQGRAKGIVVEFTRKLPDRQDYLYRARILQDGNRAFLFCGLAQTGAADAKAALDPALDCFIIQDVPKDGASLPPGKGLANFCNSIALQFDRQGDEEQALRWLKHANAAPNNDPVFLQNLLVVGGRAGRPADALSIYEKLRVNFPGNVKHRAEAARLYSQSGRRDEALKLFSELFEAGHRNDEDLASLVGVHLLLKNPKAGLEALERFADNKNAPALRRLRALALSGLGRADDAIKDLVLLRKEEPGNPMNVYRLADLLANAGRHEEIVAQTAEYLAKNAADVDVLHYQGVAQLRLKRNEEAKKSFESALRIQPANEEIKDLLAHASAMLGQGDNSQIKSAVDPVSIPPDLLKAPTEAPDDYIAGYNAYYRLAIRAISIEKAEGDRCKIRTTEHRVVKVVDREGAESFNSLTFAFNPRGEDIYINSLVVRDEKGAVIGTGKVEDYYVLDDSDTSMATNDRTVHAPVPGLRPGCTIEYEYTRIETLAANEAPFVRSVLTQGLPVLRSVFLLHDPAGRVTADASPSLKSARKGGVIYWTLDRPNPFAFEPLMAPWHTFQPMVTIGDPKASWSKLGKEYLESIQSLLEPEVSMKAIAQRVVGDLKSDAEKVQALARYVQEELTYKAIEFGRRARVPQPVTAILKNRYGDCKDHALLLHQLLQAAGVPSNFTLINSGGCMRRQFPALDQFDHAIVYVPSVAGGLFVDCTRKSSTFDVSPGDFAGYEALVLNPKEPALTKVVGMGNARLKVDRQVIAKEDGDLEVREKVTASDEFASNLRDSLRYRDVESRRRGIEAMLKRAEPTLELREFEIEQLTDPTKPLVLKLVSNVRRKAQQIGSQYVVHVPAAWEHVYLDNQPVQRRRTPFELRAATEIESAIQLQTPKGWRAPSKAKDSVPQSLKYSLAESTTNTSGDTIERRARVTLKRGNFPADAYSQFVRETESLKGLYSPDIAFEKL